MTFEERNRPRSLPDLVFKAPAVQQAVYRCAEQGLARNLLLYGPAGSGKSATCRILAMTLTGGDRACIRTINVSHLSAKGALASAITKQSLANTWNPLGRSVIILEELDGADAAAQRALKGILDDQAQFTLFLATTNELLSIGKPIRDRFEIHHVDRPGPLEWAPRAQQILANESHTASLGMVQNLLLQKAPAGTSMRDVMRVLQDHVAATIAANAPAVQPIVPSASTVSP